MAVHHVRLILSAEEPIDDPKILTDIGRIITSWANFEATVDHEIRVLQKDPKAGKASTERATSTTKRLDLWKRLTNKIYGAESSYAATVRAIVKHSLALSEHRNVLCHGIWRGHRPPDAFELATLKPKDGKFIYTEHTIGFDGLDWLRSAIKSIHHGTITYLHARLEGRDIRLHLGEPPPRP